MRYGQGKTFLSSMLWRLVAISAVTILASGGFFALSRFWDFLEVSRKLRENYVAEQKAVMRDEVTQAVASVQYELSLAEVRLRESIRRQADNAHALATNIYEKNHGKIPDEVIAETIREALRSLRFNNGRGYFFITRLDGVEILFADRPELEGQNLLQMVSQDGKPVIQDMIALTRQAGGGFYEYQWTKPGAAGTGHRKIAYLRHFSPFDWFIGTGEYLEDVEGDIQGEVLERLARVRFGKEGYLFGSTLSGNPLFTSGKVIRGGPSVWDLTDPNGVKIIQEQSRIARESEGGFMEYSWVKLNGHEPSPKIAFVKSIPEWGWQIGAGFYVDDIDGEIATRAAILREGLVRSAYPLGGLLLALLGLSFLIARSFARRLRSHLLAFRTDCNKENGAGRVDASGLEWTEFLDLAQVTNHQADLREAAEAEVRERTGALDRYFTLSLDLLCITDQEGRFQRLNPEWKKVLGYPLENLIGKMSLDFVHPEDVQGTANAVGHLGHGQDVLGFINRFRCADGTYRWLEWRGRPSGGMIYSVARDITERKKIEESLKITEQRFRTLLNDVDMVAVQGYDKDRRVFYWNKASERIYGYTEREALGLKLEDLIVPGGMHAVVIRDIQGWLENGTPIKAGEMILERKDETLIPVYSSHVMLENASGEKELYCIDVDLTEIKKVHEQLLLAKESAEAANKAKSEFLANMSHEIRTPLNGIMGMLQLIQDTSLDEEQNQFLGLAMESSKRLTRLLSDILDLARVEAGKLQMQVEAFELDALMKQIAALHEPVSLQTGVRFQVSQHPGLPSSILGDSVRLQQVLTNLIGNSFKFTTSGSVSLEINQLPSRRPGEAHVLFVVSDTGCGMDESMLEKLFEPFTQASQGNTRRYQGAGLGLSIVKRIVELMGGTISVESEIGVGTTFYVATPFKLIPSDAVGEEKSTSTGDAFAQGEFRILIAEDDMVSSLSVSRLLEKKGFHTHVAGDGQEALDALREMDFDLILMDVQMPVMDGVEATTRIRAGEAGWAKAGIPIIAMTAYSMAGDREKFLEAGMDDYVAKPVDNADVLAAMARVKAKRLGLCRCSPR
jgi:PAS domain S-box-containing protein